MILKTLRLLVILLVLLFFARPVTAENVISVKLATVQAQDPYSEFEQLLQEFNRAFYAKKKSIAVTYLTKIEHLLTDLKDVDHTRIHVALAYAYAQVGDVEKARLYQTAATATARGKTTLSVANLNDLAQSFLLLNDQLGMKTMYEKVINNAPKTTKRTFQIAYVNSLFGIDDNVKASSLLTELYTDAPLSTNERAEILSLLIINSIKLNQQKLLDQYYTELLAINTPPSANSFLARGMYLTFKHRYTEAARHYQKLLNGFNQGRRQMVYLEGVLQLATLQSIQLKKDSANYYFTRVASVLKKPVQNTAVGMHYLNLYRAHQVRFNQWKGAQLDPMLKIKDSIYQNELISVTRELTYRHKIEQDKQKAILVQKQRTVERLMFDKKRQQMLWLISSLALLLLGGGIIIYLLYQRRKQGQLLHRAELDRLKQLHRADVIKKLSASQEAERWRIADQLHDEVGSMISVIRLNLSEHPMKNEVLSPEKLATANRILATVADTVREMSHELMPVAIRQYGLINAIEQLINDINTAGKVYIEHLIHGFEDLSKYPEDFQVSFYRIVQELFQNIVKHSKATNAIFQLIEHPDSINLYIEDNGKGINSDQRDKTGKGIGLLTNRIDYFEGKISIEGAPGKGTLIVIDIPTLHMGES